MKGYFTGTAREVIESEMNRIFPRIGHEQQLSWDLFWTGYLMGLVWEAAPWTGTRQTIYGTGKGRMLRDLT